MIERFHIRSAKTLWILISLPLCAVLILMAEPLLRHNLNTNLGFRGMNDSRIEGELDVRPSDPTWSQSRTFVYAALSVIRRGDPNDANRLVERALTVGTEREREWAALVIATALVRSAKELEIKGQLDQAEAYYRHAVSRAPKNPQTHSALGSFLELYRRDLPGAIAELEAEIQLRQTPLNMLALASRYRYVRRFGDAQNALNWVQRYYPDYTEQVLIESGWLAVDQKDSTGAVHVLESARKRFPQSADVWYTLAVAYGSAGRVDDSLKATDRAIELNPNLTWAYLHMANILIQQNQLDRAESYLTRMLALNIPVDRTRVLGFISLGDVYLRAKRPDLARRAFCEAQSINRWGESAATIEQRITDLKGCN
ncbi:MAG: tetratricopeptide repeat protein [Chloroflexi bacterium]|nr:tetratricopeptide repeat protein [Chloroflexota bacterium]